MKVDRCYAHLWMKSPCPLFHSALVFQCEGFGRVVNSCKADFAKWLPRFGYARDSSGTYELVHL